MVLSHNIVLPLTAQPRAGLLATLSLVLSLCACLKMLEGVSFDQKLAGPQERLEGYLAVLATSRSPWHAKYRPEGKFLCVHRARRVSVAGVAVALMEVVPRT